METVDFAELGIKSKRGDIWDCPKVSIQSLFDKPIIFLGMILTGTHFGEEKCLVHFCERVDDNDNFIGEGKFFTGSKELKDLFTQIQRIVEDQCIYPIVTIKKVRLGSYEILTLKNGR
ncbi:MAG: hypothetical protein IJ180_00420 [Bacteroidales bacterium]|nr:hypothetical protein [Bacteroidales bacterium]